jgi:hypothetical protein
VLAALVHSSLSTNTPLYLACRSAAAGAVDTALLLIAAGADVNSKNFGQGTDISHCETPLHAAAEVFAPRRNRAAVSSSETATECDAMLHSEVTAPSQVTSLSALMHMQVIDALLASGALINARNKYVSFQLLFRPVVAAEFAQHIPPRSHGFVRVGQTPMHKAAFMGHAGNIRCLLAASADKNARTK